MADRPAAVTEIASVHCNFCDPGGVRPLTLCARVHNIYICFQCTGQIVMAFNTQAAFVEVPGEPAGA